MDFYLKTSPVIKERYKIGFLDDNYHNDFHNQILAGIAEAASELNVDIIRFGYYSSHIAYKFSHQVDMVLDHIGQYDLDGLIFLGWTQAGAMYNYKNFMSRFGSIPVLSIGTSYDDIPSVYFEGDKFIEKMILHLIEEHHFSRIAYLEHYRPDERTDTYIRTLSKFGIYDPQLYVGNTELPAISGEERIRQAVEILLDKRKLYPDAIISLNIIETGFLLNELRKRGIRVPGDIAVTSYEDGDIARFSSPGYTTIYFPWRELGRMGCTNIVKLLREGKIPKAASISDSGFIVYRESCGCMPYYVRSADIKQVTPVSHKLSEITEKECLDIVGSMDAIYSDTGIRSDILAKSFIDACSMKNRAVFLTEMKRQLRNVRDYHRIEELVSWIRKLFYPYLLNDVETFIWAGDLFLQSQVIINEKGACLHGSKVLEARMTDQSLQTVSQSMLFKFDLKNLVDSLEKGMPLLNIRSCYIFISNSIFTGSDVEENLFDNSVLIFRYKDGKKENTSGEAGNLRQQLSELLAVNHETVSLANLLHVTDEIMGFALFGPGPMDEKVYQTLSTHISTALRGIVLLNRLNITYKKLVEHAQWEGMADIAANILHNIGNILNSINVSVHMMEESSKSSVTDDIIMAGKLLQENMHRLEDFICSDVKGRKLMQLYLSLGRAAEKVQNQLEYNLERLKSKIGAINEAVSAQQSYAGVDQRLEELYIEPILSDVLKLNQDDFDKYHIEVVKNFTHGIKAFVNRAKLFFVLFNIVSNAKDAIREASGSENRLAISMYEDANGKFIRIDDTGIGISEAIINRIFDYGFTTKPGKYGYGLYSCVSYMNDMGGSIRAQSKGEGKGASFILRL